MAYIYKKSINGKIYYYLRISKRTKSGVVTKDIAYLGNDASKIYDRLKEIPAKYKEYIRKAYRNIKKTVESEHFLATAKEAKIKHDDYIETALLLKAEAAKAHYNSVFLKLDPKTIHEVYDNFLIEFAYNTTSIEGNTITLHEAERLLRENLTPKDKEPREIFDLQNTKRTFFYLIEEKPKINEDTLVLIHDMLIENIDKRKGYRMQDIRIFKSHFDASPAEYVRADMGILFKWYEANKCRLHPMVIAAAFHHKLEKIHPFNDGNGRTGRMMMNFMLMLSGYPPVIIPNKNRPEYLNALSKADKARLDEAEPKYYRELASYLASEMAYSYWNCFLV